MPDPSSRSPYDARLHRVLEHIDRHLDAPLDLDVLADVANFSRFHFHRVFAAWAGETLGDYLRRRRLEVAASRLAAQPRLTVHHVAMSVGFTAPEAFTRAFTSRFGVSPSAWRRDAARRDAARRAEDRNPGQVNSNLSQARSDEGWHRPRSTVHQEPAMPMSSVTVITREPIRVAYMRYTGPYGPGISEFWRTIVAPWMATHQLMPFTRYGVSLDDPAVTAPAQCRYDACVEVPSDFALSGGALFTTIPGGRYAVLRYHGPLAQISRAWDAVLRDWLPQSGMQLDHRPMFERYASDMRYDPHTGRIECDICIPVAPL
jgi:AraC family transcriptional regulator